MRLADLLYALPPVVPAQPAFPRRLLGAFRRKSITFCTGVTDEATVVYWFQSRSFTLDLRLPDGAATSVSDRQGWVGDTLWDEERQQMSWSIARSYQPRNHGRNRRSCASWATACSNSPHRAPMSRIGGNNPFAALSLACGS